jgi:G3E family GTPase
MRCGYATVERAKGGGKGVHGAGSIPEAVQQIAFADRVILNKLDLVSEEELSEVKASVLAINPNATLITSLHSKVPVEEILNIHAFDARNLNVEALQLDQQTEPEGGGGKPATATATAPAKKGAGSFEIRTGEDGKILNKTVRTGRKNANIDKGIDKNIDLRSSEGSGVSTVSLTTEEPLDLNAFNLWVAGLLKDKGNDLYRFKGAL